MTLLLFSILANTVAFAKFHTLAFNFSKNVKMNSDECYIEVPFHYQENNYYCGPAALEMVFDSYGEDIPQSEVADAARTAPYVTYTDEMRRAGHFSNFSASSGEEMPTNITGYSLRKLGYGAFEQGGLTISQLKSLIDNGYPIIVLMWFTPAKVYGHYRVVVGYNETHIILHDPWNKEAWGDTYGGPDVAMPESTFLDLWEYVGYWGLLTCPWNVTLTVPNTIELGNTFTVTTNATYACPEPFSAFDYPASSCNVTINLPTGLSLESGEIAKKTLGTGNLFARESATVSWTVKANNCGSYAISVAAEGLVSGAVGEHNGYPSYDYEDRIGGSNSQTVQIEKIINVPDDFATIQAAINNASDGNIIQVQANTYYEHIIINKTVSLVGENSLTTIIDGNQNLTVVHIIASNVEIRGFTIQNSGDWPHCGMRVWNSTGITISNNIVKRNYYGIELRKSQNLNLSSNMMIENFYAAVHISYSNSSNFIRNTIANNFIGVWIDYCDLPSTLYHNDFLNNTNQIQLVGTAIWDNGHEGNYWSDYMGLDDGTDSRVRGDGVGDTDLPHLGNDYFPLIAPKGPIPVTWENTIYSVGLVTNSTVALFNFTQSLKEISFNVVGPNNSTGFCNVTIPLNLMWCDQPEQWQVTIDNEPPKYFPTPIDNETYTSLYFTYNHSAQKVKISSVYVVPEFSITVLLLLFIISALILINWSKILSDTTKKGRRNKSRTKPKDISQACWSRVVDTNCVTVQSVAEN